MKADRFIPHLREFLSALGEDANTLIAAKLLTKWKRSLRSLRKNGLGPPREQQAAIQAMAWELFFRLSQLEQTTQDEEEGSTCRNTT